MIGDKDTKLSIERNWNLIAPGRDIAILAIYLQVLKVKKLLFPVYLANKLVISNMLPYVCRQQCVECFCNLVFNSMHLTKLSHF